MPDISLSRVDSGGNAPRLNVVFLHGLGGDPVKTWCHEGGEDDGYFWLKGLAEDVDNIAVWTLGYPSDKASWNAGWPLATAAVAVLDKLMSSRAFRDTGEAPVALVCHSLGGLIAKKLVLTAHLDRGQQPTKGAFLDRIAGIAFLATPHSGSILASIASFAHWFVSHSVVDLKASDATLLDLSHSYRDRIANREADIRHRVYYESVGIWGTKAVTAASSDPGLAGVRPIAVKRDHSAIAKPTSKTDVVYEGILAFLQDEVLQPRVPSQNEKIDKIQANVDALVDALSEKRELSRKLQEAEVSRNKVVALARRIAENVDDFDQALKELEAHTAVAIEVEREGRSSNLGAFVDAVLARVRKKFEQNDFDGAAGEADRGFAEWERQESERRQGAIEAGLKILDAGLKQDILRRNASAAVNRIVRKVALQHAEQRGDRLWAFVAAFEEWYERGRDKGLNFDLEIAMEIARVALQERRSADEIGVWQNRLGMALAALGRHERGTARLKEAGTAYRVALQNRTRERVPLDWATIQNNLGNALLRLGERESDAAQLEEAIVTYRAALEELKRERDPLGWATTQNNLGTALVALGKRASGTTRLEEAVKAYRAALEERTRERVPQDWAKTQNNLGNALSKLGEREGGTVRFEEAVKAYRAALEELKREREPLEWAGIQNNLGTALVFLAEHENGTTRLEEAVAAFRAALEEWTRERVPLEWAMACNNLGAALVTLGQIETNSARLEEAVVVYRAALKERTRARVPLDWATTQNNLGNVLARLGEREGGTARLEEAVVAYRAALEERTRERVPLDWAMTLNNLGSAFTILGKRASGTGRLEEAVAAYRAAIEERTRERVPQDWAKTQNNLGNALLALGQRASGTALLKEAVKAFRAAQEERTRERTPQRWAMSHGDQGVAMLQLAERTADIRLAEQALTQVETARDVLRERGFASFVTDFKAEIAIGRTLVKKLYKGKK